jgi:hypothetical protein
VNNSQESRRAFHTELYNTNDTTTQSFNHDKYKEPTSYEPSKACAEARLESWFYGNLIDNRKTSDDHMYDLELNSVQLACKFPPIGLPNDVLEQVTSWSMDLDQMKQMPLPDISAKLLDNAFGSLLKIADKTPNHAAILNNFGPSREDYCERTVEGHRSFFGEDAGPTPNQIAHKETFDASKTTESQAANATGHRAFATPPGADVSEIMADIQKIQSNNGRGKWLGPHGFAAERGLDRGIDLAGLVDFENDGAMVTDRLVLGNNVTATGTIIEPSAFSLHGNITGSGPTRRHDNEFEALQQIARDLRESEAATFEEAFRAKYGIKRENDILRPNMNKR